MPQIVQFALILAVILVLVGAFVVALRRLTGGKLVSAEPERSRNRQPRLGVVDVYDLDRTRQLVLLRRDNVEHLLLIGGPNDVVIESNIVRVASGKPNIPSEMPFDRPELSIEPTGRMLPEQARPIVESGGFRHGAGEAMPLTPIPEEPATEPPTPEPAYTPGYASPPPQQAVVAATSFAAVAAATQYGQEVSESVEADVPDFLRGHHGARRYGSSPSSPPELAKEPLPHAEIPEFTKPIAEPPTAYSPEPASFGGYRAPQPAAEPEPEQPQDSESKYDFTFGGLTDPIGTFANTLPQEQAPARRDPVFESVPAQEPAPEPEPEPVAEAPEDEPPPSVPPVAEQPIQIDETVLSDMARQLEEALKGSSRALPAVESAAEEAEEAEIPEQHAATDTPVEVSSTVEDIVTEIVQIETVVEPAEEPVPPQEEEQEKPVEPVEETKATEPEKDGTEHEVAVKAKAAAKPSSDPFSLDDIEAEFARLLGRTDDKADKT